MTSSKPVLLCPAGDFESLAAGLQAGADAVYFGVGRLNMRSRAAANFRPEDLPEIASRCHQAGAQAWLALNTIVYDSEIPEVKELLAAARQSGLDAIIASDLAVMQLARQTGLSVHLSVQANISNLEAVRFFSQFADVMVLSRELRLPEIAAIAEGIRRDNICGPLGQPVKLEVFVHGALCIGMSGRCLMSLATCNHSANRGACVQPCRRRYLVRDLENGQEMQLENQFVMSPSDLCTLPHLDSLLEAGVSVLKIEGRGRSPDYVAAVTRAYRTVRDAWLAGRHLSEEETTALLDQVSRVFNRGFWLGGYYLGEPTGVWCGAEDSKATVRKDFLGLAVNYFARPGIAELRITTAQSFRTGDRLLVTGPTTGALEFTVGELRVNELSSDTARQNDDVTFAVPATIRRGDKFYRLTPIKFGFDNKQDSQDEN